MALQLALSGSCLALASIGMGSGEVEPDQGGLEDHQVAQLMGELLVPCLKMVVLVWELLLEAGHSSKGQRVVDPWLKRFMLVDLVDHFGYQMEPTYLMLLIYQYLYYNQL